MSRTFRRQKNWRRGGSKALVSKRKFDGHKLATSVNRAFFERRAHSVVLPTLPKAS